MYKVIIVDDEEIMREGLINLVDWKTMGFNIVAQFEDGEEALEYLKENSVDVLLTDIKMTFVSGLDLARYVNDQKLSTKTVFISGYKDFEYARQAVSYNVVQYLLKPISLGDIHRVFREIRQELDREREQKNKEESSLQQYSELLSFMRDQFFIDLALGALRDRKELEKRLSFLDLKTDLGRAPCCILSISLGDYSRYIHRDWGYGEDELYTAIYNFFYGNNGAIQYHFINGREGKLKLLAIGQSDLSIDGFIDKMKDGVRTVENDIGKVMGLVLTVRIEECFNSIYELAIHPRPVKAQSTTMNYQNHSGYTEIAPEDREHLIDQHKLLMTHVRNGNQESTYSVFEQIMEDIRPLGLKGIQSFMVDFFAALINQLDKNGIKVEKILKKGIIYSDILKLETLDEIRDWGWGRLSEIISNVGKYEESSDTTIISRIKSYIRKHYNQDITLEQVADHVFLSPVYVSRLFKEQTDENFSDYLIRVRMEKAMELLKNPCYKVYEVGHMIGYNSIKYFYRLFKRFVGCTPTEYRKNLCGGGDG